MERQAFKVMIYWHDWAVMEGENGDHAFHVAQNAHSIYDLSFSSYVYDEAWRGFNIQHSAFLA